MTHKLLLDSKLACLIGANEAGKSSLLKVINEARSSNEVPKSDRTRRSTVPDEHEIIKLRFRLDDEDQAAIAPLYEEDGYRIPQWITYTKTAGGSLSSGLDNATRRSMAKREAAQAALTDSAYYRASGTVDDAGDWNAPQEFKERTDALLDGAIVNDLATLNDATLTEIDELSAILTEAGEDDAAAALDRLVESERSEHPYTTAMNVMHRRTPKFVLFGLQERNLQSEYDIDAAAANTPPALLNLLQLAELDLADLVTLLDDNETGSIQDVIARANEKLAETFSYWKQTPAVRVTFWVRDRNLAIHVQSGDGTSMRFEERSDGLRQFVALVAATAPKRGVSRPILLIDEVETHLHYDAQVDLLRLLAEQDEVGQVIYSTHSAACLPDDLGNVRVVQSDSKETRSTIRQHFWSNTPGLGPLLMAMGAASLAFVPRRASLIAEGPSELLLLPTLIKEVTGIEDLGYQVAPGIANARPGTIIGLDMQASRTAWLVDGDPGGMANKTKLMKDGIAEESIVVLGGDGSNVILEDLIAPVVLADAVTAYAHDKGVFEPLDPVVLDGNDRIAEIEKWSTGHGIAPPGKVVLANRLLSMRSERDLVCESQREEVRRIHDVATAAVKLQADPAAPQTS